MKVMTLPAGLARPAVLVLSAAPALAATADAETFPVAGTALVRAENPVPRQETARAQLEHASGLKLALRGSEGEAKAAARMAAVRAYRAVREHFEGDAKACAEASFRAGELLRAAEDDAAALSEFKIARERGAGTPFRVRAMLEIGHVQRRGRHAQDALAAYEGVISDAGATPGQKDDASYWAGHVYVQLERSADAMRAWQRVADGAEDPLDRVRAWDCIALEWVGKGDLEAGAGALERCREALSEVAAEETRLGERVRSALAAMRAVDELQRAVEKRLKEREAAKKERSSGKPSGKKGGSDAKDGEPR